MSTTIHVGKCRMLTLTVPPGWTCGFDMSLDGKNLINDQSAPNATKLTCVSVEKRGDYVPGQPVSVRAVLSPPTPTPPPTMIYYSVNLVAADAPEPPVNIPGTDFTVDSTWGPEE